MFYLNSGSKMILMNLDIIHTEIAIRNVFGASSRFDLLNGCIRILPTPIMLLEFMCVSLFVRGC